jgi:hypothetical protein
MPQAIAAAIRITARFAHRPRAAAASRLGKISDSRFTRRSLVAFLLVGYRHDPPATARKSMRHCAGPDGQTLMIAFIKAG